MSEYEIAYRANRNHKDTVFRDLFGTEENRANALSLYNALRGTSYDDPSELEITTLGNVIYMGVKNDVSFLIGDETVLWEHQSTYNPNMPLRGLSYFAHLYTKWVEEKGYSAYDYRRIPLPRPRYAVFYIGREERPDCEVVRLSDAFMSEDAGDRQDALEVTATVYNVNEGHNEGLASACSALAGYARLVATIREGRSRGMGADDAVDWAIRRCIDDGVLADYLSRRRAEVKDMLLTEFDMEDTARRIAARHREEYIREGEERGLKIGEERGLKIGEERGLKIGEERGLKIGEEQGIKLGEERQREAFLARAAEAVSSGALTAEEASRLFGFDADEIQSRLEESAG